MICLVKGDNKCNHIFGYEEGVGYEAWLMYKPLTERELEMELIDTPFKYCPLCGGEITYIEGSFAE